MAGPPPLVYVIREPQVIEAIEDASDPLMKLAEALVALERANRIHGFTVVAVEQYENIVVGYVEVGTVIFYARLAKDTKDAKDKYVLTLVPVFSTCSCYCGEV